jgi:hypothetical protein
MIKSAADVKLASALIGLDCHVRLGERGTPFLIIWPAIGPGAHQEMQHFHGLIHGALFPSLDLVSSIMKVQFSDKELADMADEIKASTIW